jgi:hypothetical protein
MTHETLSKAEITPAASKRYAEDYSFRVIENTKIVEENGLISVRKMKTNQP